jgi:hypothetical protein
MINRLEIGHPTYEMQQLEMMLTSQKGDEFISSASNFRSFFSSKRRNTKVEHEMNMEN